MGEQLSLDFTKEIDFRTFNLEIIADNIIEEIEDINCPISDYQIKEKMFLISDQLNTLCPCDPEYIDKINQIKHRMINLQTKVMVKNNIQDSIDRFSKIKTKKLIDNKWGTVKLIEYIQEYNGSIQEGVPDNAR